VPELAELDASVVPEFAEVPELGVLDEAEGAGAFEEAGAFVGAGTFVGAMVPPVGTGTLVCPVGFPVGAPVGWMLGILVGPLFGKLVGKLVGILVRLLLEGEFVGLDEGSGPNVDGSGPKVVGRTIFVGRVEGSLDGIIADGIIEGRTKVHAVPGEQADTGRVSKMPSGEPHLGIYQTS
jgi:hypothetical protein